MRLYNTLTRRAEPFEPRDPSRLTLYVCGPTVYDDPHIGHARSAYIFDILRRYLAHRFPTTPLVFVRNVTDVDDKIIEKARQEVTRSQGHKVTSELEEKCREVTDKYLKSYHATMDRLGIGRPDVEPKATEHIDAMQDMISKLLIDGTAYEAGGDVYFAVRKFPSYGKLSNRALDELQAGARVEPGERKQDPLDFALWKAAKPGEPSWPSPWGTGRPGWHIECSAMSTKYLGDQFDIHGGGVDLVFPHHENEVAQAQAAGKPFARFWVHNGLLTVKGEKMSKSLGNFITVGDALETAFQKPDALKVFFLGTHYRSPIDWTKENVLAANRRLNGWISFLDGAESYRKFVSTAPSISPEIRKLEGEFVSAMEDDLNTPGALAALDKLVAWGQESERKLSFRQVESGSPSPVFRLSPEIAMLWQTIVTAADTFRRLGNVFFSLFSDSTAAFIPKEVQALVEEREKARQDKDFKRADELRREIEQLGFLVADSSGWSVIRPKR